MDKAFACLFTYTPGKEGGVGRVIVDKKSHDTTSDL